jgi:ubiquinone/menaquinone biosynthesis C-methylase UbiE
MNTKYIGGELEIFKEAHNWKAYWFNNIKPFIGSSILDVGAGIGSTVNLISESNQNIVSYTALEPDIDNIKKLKDAKLNKTFLKSYKVIHGDITSIKKNVTFDTILYIDVLEHIQQDSEELNLAKDFLAPGGNLIVLSPAHQFLFSKFDESIGHFRRYNKKDLKKIKPDGLHIKNMKYLDSMGVLASAANRLFLNEELPSSNKIKLWNNYLIPMSKLIDKITFHKLGKTIIAVYSKPKTQNK